MKRILFLFLALCTGFLALAQEPAWRARWISKSQSNSGSNEWIAFRKRINLDKVPQSLPARIAADTKYWLWINGELAVYEGGLKRGPAPGDGYVDTVDIAPWLRPGENLISILVWHLGRNGFSHLDSGMAALLFEADLGSQRPSRLPDRSRSQTQLPPARKQCPLRCPRLPL